MEEIGNSADYYRRKGFEYIVVSERHFSKVAEGLRLLKEFSRGRKGIRIYSLDTPHSKDKPDTDVNQ